VLIARLMLEPADLLLLDEPTNDLDIPTLEILEESLLEFRGALVLVTHDRYMLDRVSNIVLGVNGQGGADTFADYGQWEGWQAQRSKPDAAKAGAGKTSATSATAAPASTKKKLSYLEAREYATIEQRVEDAEDVVQAKRAELENPANATDASRLVNLQADVEAAQEELDLLYARWAELEKKSS
jgi:ATP-binding cassette subfamily F protein uup